MFNQTRNFNVDYALETSDYGLREMVQDANFEQGDDVDVNITDGLIVIRRVNDD